MISRTSLNLGYVGSELGHDWFENSEEPRKLRPKCKIADSNYYFYKGMTALNFISTIVVSSFACKPRLKQLEHMPPNRTVEN